MLSLKKKIQNIQTQYQLQNELTIKLDENGLDLQFLKVAWFKSGSSDINHQQIKKFHPVFSEVAKATLSRMVDIEGHTDNSLSKNAVSYFNWSLSSSRALSLFVYLKNFSHFNEKNVRLVAYADTVPLKNTQGLIGKKLEEARNINRRVSIKIREVSYAQRQ